MTPAARVAKSPRLHALILVLGLAAATPVLAADRTEPGGADRTLVDNWNTAACGFTDTATLDVSSPIHLSRIDLWFNWQAGEQSVTYTVSANGQDFGGGTLTRGDCDPYQGAWCVARDAPDINLSSGRYEIRAARAGLCQNGGSGGAGFIKAYGYDADDQ